ncbi:lysosome-associated membrane glycoprotein 2 isoform X1 [Conger conger]|uniref:lysosome-associated membrane glycoprotein 2 isoform X1 n=1 Tax=Conger conger TaxID=82655 RepID=UPI002A5A5670|nr:lysosome-associated membrane glycoprotein 2 isoform X1 [Conger conger]
MFRYACMTLFLVLGSEIQLSYSTEASVTDAAKKLCLYAKLNVSFTVTYETIEKKNSTATFPLPELVNAAGSTCGKNASTLTLTFDKGHSWSVSFKKENESYSARDIVFKYNLGDDRIFTNASSKETKTVTFSPSISNVAMGTYYSCKSEDTMQMGLVVQSLQNVSLQAFIINGSKSDIGSVCPKDVPSTSPVPTTHVTNTTTPTAAPTAAPTTPSPLPTPTTGNYSLKTGNNSCLLAQMGLQINFKDGGVLQKMNVDPLSLEVNGDCSVNKSDSTLVLTSISVNLTFTFKEDGKNFVLHAVSVTIRSANGTSFSAANSSLSLWKAAVGSSYMCNKEQSYIVTDSFSLDTFKLHVQPFQVTGDSFATAEECQADLPVNYIVPIAVGVALGVLIIIVVVAYFIGRRRNQTSGYESF